MRKLKVIRKVCGTLYKVYFNALDRAFRLLLENLKPTSLESTNCTSDCSITSDRAIVRING